MRRHVHGTAVQAQINMTPLIDVLLVLLIVFLVIQPELQKGLDLQVPPPPEGPPPTQTPDRIVLSVEKGSLYSLNGEAIPVGSLSDRLREVYADRPRKVLFVKGAEGLRYSEVIRAVDIALGAGVVVVGLVPREGGDATP